MIAGMAAGFALAASGPRIVSSIAADLDSDAHRELVQTVEVIRPNPYGGAQPLHRRFVRVVDESGGRSFEQRVSPVLEARHHLPSAVVLVDRAFLGHVVLFGPGRAFGAPRPLSVSYWRNGKLKALRSALASSSVPAVVQTITSMPQT